MVEQAVKDFQQLHASTPRDFLLTTTNQKILKIMETKTRCLWYVSTSNFSLRLRWKSKTFLNFTAVPEKPHVDHVGFDLMIDRSSRIMTVLAQRYAALPFTSLHCLFKLFLPLHIPHFPIIQTGLPTWFAYMKMLISIQRHLHFQHPLNAGPTLSWHVLIFFHRWNWPLCASLRYEKRHPPISWSSFLSNTTERTSSCCKRTSTHGSRIF